MKKFLSICLVALCSVSAMYAQTDPNSQSNVTCDKKVEVTANSNNGYYHFVEWEIKNGTDVLETLAKDGTTNSQYGATVSTSVRNDGVETSTLTLDPLGSDLIDAVTSNPKTVTFKANFAIDSYTITGSAEGDGTVEFNNTGTSSGTVEGSTQYTLTATPNPNNCTVFKHWEITVNGQRMPDSNTSTLTVTPEATWAHGTVLAYKAVFETKTVNINAISSDTNMGTVTLTITPTAPAGN